MRVRIYQRFALETLSPSPPPSACRCRKSRDIRDARYLGDQRQRRAMTASDKDRINSAMNELAALKRRMRWIEQFASCGSTKLAALRLDVAARFGINN
jgi:hypothetical protein